MISAWEKEVKGFKGYMYRQATAKLEKNIFNEHNWIMNPILNLQSLNIKRFPLLRKGFEKIIASNKNLGKFVKSAIKDNDYEYIENFFKKTRNVRKNIIEAGQDTQKVDFGRGD